MAKRTRKDDVTLEDVRLLFRNFSGEESSMNRAGDRNFSVALNPATAKEMEADGYNIKYLKPREEDDAPQAIVKVKISPKEGGRPRRYVLIDSKGKRTNLDLESIGMLDWVDIETVDLMLSPYDWEVNGKTGTTAYLQAIYITIREDPLQAKYGLGLDDEGDAAPAPWDE